MPEIDDALRLLVVVALQLLVGATLAPVAARLVRAGLRGAPRGARRAAGWQRAAREAGLAALPAAAAATLGGAGLLLLRAPWPGAAWPWIAAGLPGTLGAWLLQRAATHERRRRE